jgi:hypothetical protein
LQSVVALSLVVTRRKFHSASFSFPASKIVAFSTLLTFLVASVEAAVTVAFEERPFAMIKIFQEQCDADMVAQGV